MQYFSGFLSYTPSHAGKWRASGQASECWLRRPFPESRFLWKADYSGYRYFVCLSANFSGRGSASPYNRRNSLNGDKISSLRHLWCNVRAVTVQYRGTERTIFRIARISVLNMNKFPGVDISRPLTDREELRHPSPPNPHIFSVKF